jgi:hypothetical protein
MTHGTYVAYVCHKCRCDECRKANNEYAVKLARRNAYGRSTLVDAEPVRERVNHLMRHGMNGHEIMRAAGVSHHTMQNLMRAHWRTGKPVKRIKRETADAIMAVRKHSLRPGTYVTRLDAVPLVLDLMSLGYSAAWITRELGMTYQGRGLLLKTHWRAGNYAKLVKLHGSTADRAPDSPQATRSRNFAQAYRDKRYKGARGRAA